MRVWVRRHKPVCFASNYHDLAGAATGGAIAAGKIHQATPVIPGIPLPNRNAMPLVGPMILAVMLLWLASGIANWCPDPMIGLGE